MGLASQRFNTKELAREGSSPNVGRLTFVGVQSFSKTVPEYLTSSYFSKINKYLYTIQVDVKTWTRYVCERGFLLLHDEGSMLRRNGSKSKQMKDFIGSF